MGNPFKKKMNRLMGKSNKSKGWEQGQQKFAQATGDRLANEGQLGAAMKEYEDAPNVVRKTYLDSARKAGTYGDTAEFEQGLQSEVQAGARGARVGIAGRINALKKALGHTDEFKPENFGQTQGNATADTIRNAPADATPATATGAPAGQDTEGSAPSADADTKPTDALSSVQTAAQKLAKLRMANMA